MAWPEGVEQELTRGRDAERLGNAGRARTCARRAAGMAITELQRKFPERKYGSDFMRQVRAFATDDSLPEEVRQAAERLQATIAADFTSVSKQPLSDAATIVDYVKTTLGNIQRSSSPL